MESQLCLPFFALFFPNNRSFFKSHFNTKMASSRRSKTTTTGSNPNEPKETKEQRKTRLAANRQAQQVRRHCRPSSANDCDISWRESMFCRVLW
jgi:hypothetical protein